MFMLQQAHKCNRRVAYAHLRDQLRRVFALYSFVPPKQLLWRQSHRAPQNSKSSHVQLSLFSEPILTILHRAKSYYSL